MTTTAIRDKLYDYIRVADDKKIKAIYTILENEIGDTVEWWNDNDFMKKLDAEYHDWKQGEQSYTSKEINEHINQLRTKRAAK